MPRDRTERILWIFVSASAGFGEEISWRGAFQVVVWLSGSLYVAMAVHFVYDASPV